MKRTDNNNAPSLCVVDCSNLIHGALDLDGVLSIEALVNLTSKFDRTLLFHADGPAFEERVIACSANSEKLDCYDVSRFGLTNVDVGLALETEHILRKARVAGTPYRRLALVSGDADFVPLLLLGRRTGLHTAVYSFKRQLSQCMHRFVNEIHLLGYEMLLNQDVNLKTDLETSATTLQPAL